MADQVQPMSSTWNSWRRRSRLQSRTSVAIRGLPSGRFSSSNSVQEQRIERLASALSFGYVRGRIGGNARSVRLQPLEKPLYS